MNISDIIAMTNSSIKKEDYLEQITLYPTISRLLHDYYRDILNLKPVKFREKVNKEELAIVIFSSFEKIEKQLAYNRDKAFPKLIAEMLLQITLLHMKEFGKNSLELYKLITNISGYYSELIKAGKNDFTSRFLVKLSRVKLNEQAKEAVLRNAFGNYLVFRGNMYQMKELELRLNLSGWFFNTVIIEKFFNNSFKEPVLFCRPFRLPYLSLLLRMLDEAGLIISHTGNCFMRMAAKHIVCIDRAVNEKLLSKLNCEIMAAPDVYKNIIEEVSKIVEAVKKAGSNG